MRTNSYVIIFVGAMTVVVAFVLSLMATGLKPIHDRNEAIFNKKAVLAAIEHKLGDNIKAKDLPDDDVENIFSSSIEQFVIDFEGGLVSQDAVESRGYKGGLAEDVDMKKEKKKDAEERIFPVYLYTDDADEKIYIVTVRGNGLWDEIWGNIALQDDFATVVGASFDHQAETPGLGAEIKDNPAFKNQFAGKQLFSENGTYTSIVVRKGGARDPVYEVDGISGATVTCDGVSKMLYDGLKYYQPYFNSLRKT